MTKESLNDKLEKIYFSWDDLTLDRFKEAISSLMAEAYKKGYIAGGIDKINELYIDREWENDETLKDITRQRSH